MKIDFASMRAALGEKASVMPTQSRPSTSLRSPITFSLDQLRFLTLLKIAACKLHQCMKSVVKVGWRIALIQVITLATITLELGITLPAYATGDYGPDTCLQGWVWREAVPSDHVCVTPDIRTQTANDNSQASARRNPNGGPYGPDTCLQGWVWREAVQDDHVCVTPATRSQAANDNSQAAARRNSLNVWHTTYTVSPACNGNTCSTGSTDSIPRYRLQGDHFNVGSLTVQLYRSRDGARLQGWTVNSTTMPSAPGGQFSLDTGKFICQGASDSYFRVFDPISTRWSSPYYVTTLCAVL